MRKNPFFIGKIEFLQAFANHLNTTQRLNHEPSAILFLISFPYENGKPSLKKILKNIFKKLVCTPVKNRNYLPKSGDCPRENTFSNTFRMNFSVRSHTLPYQCQLL